MQTRNANLKFYEIDFALSIADTEITQSPPDGQTSDYASEVWRLALLHWKRETRYKKRINYCAETYQFKLIVKSDNYDACETADINT